MKFLAAHTESGPSYPPFFNATLDGDEVIVTVRGGHVQTGLGRIAGPQVSIRVPREVFEHLYGELSNADS